MTAELSVLSDRQCVDLAKGIIYGLGLSQRQTLRVISISDSLFHYGGSIYNYGPFFREAASELGINVPSSVFCSNHEIATFGTQRIVVWNKPVPKDELITRGLSFGFHRDITLPQIIESAIKVDYCDEHVWLIESDWRILKYKHKKPLIDQSTRFRLAVASGMSDKVGVIVGKGFGDAFYRELVKMWQPDVLFINQSSGVERVEETRFRANSVGAKTVVLPEIGRSHTSDFEKYLREARLR